MPTLDLSEIPLWNANDLLQNTLECDISVKKLIEHKISCQDNDNQITSDWLKWCKTEVSRVKVTDYDVPAGILPQGFSGCLYDIKVQGKRRCPDDTLYNKYPDLRENVARGNTVLYLHNTEAGTISHECMIFALRKFTGGMGDEDENQPENNKVWTDYFLRPLESTKKVICTRKANGEAAHLSVRFVHNRFLLCVGSKNVHMLLANASDVDKHSDGRFQVARYVAEGVIKLLEGLNSNSLMFLLNFMHCTKVTAVFEVLNPASQHVEDLSHLAQTELRFISWTSSYEDRKHNSHSYCAINPDIGIELARIIGLKTVQYETITPDKVDKRMDEIRHGYGYEGEVLYFVDDKDNVIGLLKKKTAWYVVARAIREQVANALSDWKKNGTSNYDHSSRELKMNKRIGAIKNWLDLSEKCSNAWADIGVRFLKWIINKAKEKDMQLSSDLQVRDVEVRGNFPQLWKSYLEENQLSDQIRW